MTGKTRSRRIVGWTLRSVAAIAMPILVFVAWDQATYNFGEVQPGRIYPSGQMPASALAQTLREHRIKTVLNLRGSNPGRYLVSRRSRRDQFRGCDPDRHRDVILPLDVAGPVRDRWSRRSIPPNTRC